MKNYLPGFYFISVTFYRQFTGRDRLLSHLYLNLQHSLKLSTSEIKVSTGSVAVKLQHPLLNSFRAENLFCSLLPFRSLTWFIMKQEIRYWIYQYCSENSIPSLPYNHFISNKLVTIVTRLENIPQMFKNTFLLISNTKRWKIMVNYCFPVFRGVCNSCVILLKVLNKQVYFNNFFQ